MLYLVFCILRYFAIAFVAALIISHLSYCLRFNKRKFKGAGS